MKKLVYDPQKCTGCSICTMACIINHTNANVIDTKISRIRIRVNKEKLVQVANVCVQCEEAYCINTCPTGALSRDEKLGFITVNRDICISCGACVGACPYGGIILSHLDNKPLICDLCNGEPLCVKWCPFDAIKYIEVSDENIHSIKELRDKMINLSKEVFPF